MSLSMSWLHTAAPAMQKALGKLVDYMKVIWAVAINKKIANSVAGNFLGLGKQQTTHDPDSPSGLIKASTGATLAIKLAGVVEADGTVLVSPFYNINAVRQDFKIWPPTMLMRFTFNSDQGLPDVKSPVTIIHGDQDSLIDFSHSERLHALAPNAELIKIDGGTHMNLTHLPQYLDTLSARLAKL